MAEILWTEPELIDLDEAAEYIAFGKPGAAKKLVRDVFQPVKRLKQFPKSCKCPPELQNTNYLEVVVGPCRIFNCVDGNNVYMLFVMRGERKLRLYIPEDRERMEG